MRSDMVPGAVLPDYELSDHAAISPSCKDRIRWFSYSAAEVSVPRTRQAEGLVQLHREPEVAYCRLVRRIK